MQRCSTNPCYQFNLNYYKVSETLCYLESFYEIFSIVFVLILTEGSRISSTLNISPLFGWAKFDTKWGLGGEYYFFSSHTFLSFLQNLVLQGILYIDLQFNTFLYGIRFLFVFVGSQNIGREKLEFHFLPQIFLNFRLFELNCILIYLVLLSMILISVFDTTVTCYFTEYF